jgi:type III pantothenate kinase
VLAADVGNTETTVGLFRGAELASFWRLTTERMTTDEVSLKLESLLKRAPSPDGHAPERLGTVLCSVAPSLTLAWAEALERLAGSPPVEVNAENARIRVRYHDRTAVGADRIANAVAARGIYGTPAIVVDLGTATTFDCVSREGAYLGGAIAPGLATSAEELFRRAARLPRVGVIWGAAGQVDALVRRLALEMKGTPHVIATGGFARLVAAECETVNRVDEGLTLKGMRLVWEQNR